VAIMGPSGSGKSTLMHLGGLDGRLPALCSTAKKMSLLFPDDELTRYSEEIEWLRFQAFNLPRTAIT